MLNPVPSYLTSDSFNAIKDFLPTDLLSDLAETLEWVVGISMFKDTLKINALSNKRELENLLIDSGLSSLRFINQTVKF